MSLVPAKSLTGGERLRNILESLNLPIVTADGESFTVRRFVFYSVRNCWQHEDNILGVQGLHRLGLVPVPFPEKMLLNFPDLAAWILEAYLTCEKAEVKT
jgi:hypothetical protein